MAKKGTVAKTPAPVKIPAPVKMPTPAEVMEAKAPPIAIPSPGSGIPTPLLTAHLPMDEETKVEAGSKILSIRDLQGYPNAPLCARMESVWGVYTAIRTGTDTENSLIYLYKGDPKDPKAVQVNRSGTQNLVNFSLIVPLQKLNIRPAADRQWDIVAQELNPIDGPAVFVFNVVARDSIQRNLKDEQAEQASGGTTTAAAERSTNGSASGAVPSSVSPALEEAFKPIREKNLKERAERANQLFGPVEPVKSRRDVAADEAEESDE